MFTTSFLQCGAVVSRHQMETVTSYGVRRSRRSRGDTRTTESDQNENGENESEQNTSKQV